MEGSSQSLTPTNETQKLALRLSIWTGIIGPILYILVFTFDGALRPGYSAIGMAVSFLLLGPSSWIEIANFITLGLLLIFFAFGFSQWMRPLLVSGWRHASTVALVLVGVGFIMAALFVPDPFGSPHQSVHAMLHNVAFTVAFLPLGIACLLIGNQLRSSLEWRLHGWYSMIAGLPLCIASLGSLLFPPSSSPPPRGGLFERILILIALSWYVILASHILIQEKRGLSRK